MTGNIEFSAKPESRTAPKEFVKRCGAAQELGFNPSGSFTEQDLNNFVNGFEIRLKTSPDVDTSKVDTESTKKESSVVMISSMKPVTYIFR